MHASSERLRRPVLRELRLAERLREETESTLLSWQHPGFHVHAGEPVLPDDTERLEHFARTITRAPIRLDAITPLDAARVVVLTPPDRQTGRHRMEFDVLEMIRRLCAQIPGPRQHLVRYYGWHSHRARGVRGEGAAIETCREAKSTLHCPSRAIVFAATARTRNTCKAIDRKDGVA